MNIREISRLNPNYFEINREERNYAAILYASLFTPGNISRFLKLCDVDTNIGSDFGIYFEYSYLRDLWNIITNEIKKEIISQNLPISGISEILKSPTTEINQMFGVSGKASTEHIQYPGRWAILKYNRNFQSNDDFCKICRFKWAFNIKPDIVIHLDKNNAICIEAKYESDEGHYPSSKLEKSIFKDRGLTGNYVGQMDLQKYMMENLLSINTKFVLLSNKSGRNKNSIALSWKKVFENLDLSGMPNFAKQMVENISV